MASDSKKPLPKAPADDDSRRDFLKTACIGGLGLGLASAVGLPAVLTVTYPLDHETVSGATGFLRVGKSDLFKPGTPVKVDVFADKRDAWNRIVQVKIGSAWVLRTGDALKVFSTVCPHLGCAVDYDDAGPKFKCPCHNSAFSLDGKVEGGPSPRAMDELDVEEKDGVVSVRYVRFRQGVPQKEAV